jgi:hypothetical protein
MTLVRLAQVGQQVASANPNTVEGVIQQTIQQIAIQMAYGRGNTNQAITQVAVQTVLNRPPTDAIDVSCGKMGHPPIHTHRQCIGLSGNE